MAIKHVLKDGRTLESVNGYTVKVEQAEILYRMIDRINARGEKQNDNQT